MYMRLWWKEARQFWPIWAFLVLAATVTQGVAVYFWGPGARSGGTLAAFAQCWTILYALAVGAAMFASERETGTLRFLDILPASRQVIWSAKVSFAFVTTAVLAGIFFGIAALGSESWGPGWSSQLPVDRLAIIGMVPLALVVGLSCSSIMNNALLAALGAAGLTSIGWLILLADLDMKYRGARSDLREYLSWYLGSMLLAILGSNLAFTWSRRTRRVPFRIRFRSPVAMAWDDSIGAQKAAAAAQAQAAVAPEIRTAEPVPMPIPMTARAWSADQPRPRSWFTEFRYLAWQSMSEGRRILCYLCVFGLILPMAVYLATIPIASTRDMTFALPWNWLVALVAGISVFGLENQRRTYRFLVHHGARPGTVWLAKLVVWCIGLAIIWVPILVVTSSESQVVPREAREVLLRIALFLPLAFAVAQLCGMVIPRGITALVIALVVAMALTAAEEALVQAKMVPAWGLMALPVAFLMVTRAWSGDWLLDRPAPGRYLRLGLILTGTFGVLLAGYAGVRAWEIPDPGPIAPPSTWSAAPLPPDRNAAELYREAARQADLMMGDIVIRSGPVLDLIRKAAAMPDCRFSQSGRINSLNPPDLPPMRKLADLMIAHARDGISRKDLTGAWDDIAVLLRMARHVSEGATTSHELLAFSIEQLALDLAIDWAKAPGQTPERLRAAIAAYRDLPGLTPAAEAIRCDAVLFERTLDLPTDDLRGPLLELMVGKSELASGNVPIATSLYIDMITTPWERIRARRVDRRFTGFLIQNAPLEPWQQELGPGLPIARELESAPLASYLARRIGACLGEEGRNEVWGRALVQVMAVRAWQLRHGGRFPDRLEDLVPDELPSLPNDPYAGKPFGYLTYEQFRRTATHASPGTPAARGSRILYSVGPDGQDDHGVSFAPASVDISFWIPPLGFPEGQGGEPATTKELARPAPPPAARP